MAQKEIWEREYRQPQLVTKGEEPQKDVLRLFKDLRRKHGVAFEELSVIDLGSGTGRNSNYLAGLGAKVVGVEIAPTAVRLSRLRAEGQNLSVKYFEQSMSDRLPVEDLSIDLAIDITSSNSLLAKERATYLKELDRIIKPGGYFVLKTLALDGDKNAKALLKLSPGPEPYTYKMKELGLVEHVFSREELMELYGGMFKLIELEKKTSYTRMNGQSYKRNFWLSIWQKNN
jgi:SAM-dependent methyltransferase